MTDDQRILTKREKTRERVRLHGERRAKERQLKGALAAVAVVLLAAVFLPPLAERWAALTERRQTSVSLSEWRSPTESLLRAPAHELMQSAPRLGEFYFPLDSLFPETGSENGGTNNES